MKLILLSVHDETSTCRASIAAGADGFVLKRAIGSELLPAIDAVLLGHTYVSSGILPGNSSTGENSAAPS